jgi:hypothetical protein
MKRGDLIMSYFSKVFIVLITLFLTGSLLFAGDIYTWTDENGTVHFSDSGVPNEHREDAKTMDTAEGESAASASQYVDVEPTLEEMGMAVEEISLAQAVKIAEERYPDENVVCANIVSSSVSQSFVYNTRTAVMMSNDVTVLVSMRLKGTVLESQRGRVELVEVTDIKEKK